MQSHFFPRQLNHLDVQCHPIHFESRWSIEIRAVGVIFLSVHSWYPHVLIPFYDLWFSTGIFANFPNSTKPIPLSGWRVKLFVFQGTAAAPCVLRCVFYNLVVTFEQELEGSFLSIYFRRSHKCLKILKPLSLIWINKKGWIRFVRAVIGVLIGIHTFLCEVWWKDMGLVAHFASFL